MDKRIVEARIKKMEDKISNRVNKCLKNPKSCVCNIKKMFKFSEGKRSTRSIETGKILHLDGDRKYTEKSIKYYKSLGLNAIVKNIPENKQAQVVRQLLERYNPDILIITGHDGMIKKGTGFNDIYNYRNSRHFINTVSEARKWKKKELAIFAGACQSYYEAIMAAGANFASSPRKNND